MGLKSCLSSSYNSGFSVYIPFIKKNVMLYQPSTLLEKKFTFSLVNKQLFMYTQNEKYLNLSAKK